MVSNELTKIDVFDGAQVRKIQFNGEWFHVQSLNSVRDVKIWNVNNDFLGFDFNLFGYVSLNQFQDSVVDFDFHNKHLDTV